MIERLGNAVGGLHHEHGDEEHEISWFSLKPKVDVFSWFGLKTGGYSLVVWPQNHSLGFPDLGLKIGSYGLVIWLTKSSWQFLGLGLKTKWAMVFQLRDKTDRRMKTARDTHQDLASCFA
jgi:hypothetical protein